MEITELRGTTVSQMTLERQLFCGLALSFGLFVCDDFCVFSVRLDVVQPSTVCAMSSSAAISSMRNS